MYTCAGTWITSLHFFCEMNMARLTTLFLLMCSVSFTSASVGSDSGKRLCGISNTPGQYTAVTDIGGRYIPAEATYRVLVVFASFPDDLAPHPFWPARQAPLFMQQFIDPDTITRSQSPYNLTNYFRQMSMGKFNLIGDAIWVETGRSQEEYRNGAYGRANRDVLMERVDPVVDFALYDQWSRPAAYQNSNTPDGIVDMIIMVWRTNMFEFVGEASLGYRASFVVDGKRIEMGYPEYAPMPLGSGVTCQYLYTDSPYNLMQTMVHELAHWLLGGPHPYNGESPQGKYAYWGMLCNPQRMASCANAYERERLGWITVPEIPHDSTIVLGDFVTTGAAAKYRPPNGEGAEFFYLESHLKISPFDDVTANQNDTGVWILHQQGPYMELDNLGIRPADGNWNWTSTLSSMACFSQFLPLFQRGAPAVVAGRSHRQQIPTATSAVNWMLAYKDEQGILHCGKFAHGDLFAGAFTGGMVFSPYSNPPSHTWRRSPSGFSLEVGESPDGYTVRSYANPLEPPPARRFLGSDTNLHSNNRLALAWGTGWQDGQPLEPDVIGSELQMSIGSGGNWVTVYNGGGMNWNDGSILLDSAGTPARFRVRVRDSDGNTSGWSNTYYTRISVVNSVNSDARLSDSSLLKVYPNPANPAATVQVNLPASGHVRLLIRNTLGQQVRQLFSGYVSNGIQAVEWDGRGESGGEIPSGVYFLTLVSEQATVTRKLVLIR